MDEQKAKVMGVIVLVFIAGVIFQILGCSLWHNWWPMLTAFMYVLVPMPYLFFGDPNGDSSGGWADAGKFLTGFSAVGTIAVPTILHHAGKITGGALWMELVAVVCMGTSLLAYDIVSKDEGGTFFSSTSAF